MRTSGINYRSCLDSCELKRTALISEVSSEIASSSLSNNRFKRCIIISERINGSLATEDRINKNLKLASTLTIKHMGLQPRNSLGWRLGGCVKCLPYKGSIFIHLVPRDAGEWKLPADSVLSGMCNTCIVHLGKC